MRKVSVISSLLFTLFACTTVPVREGTEDAIVVEGWIEAGFPPVVILTTSVAPSEEYRTMEDLNDHLVRWAKVTVSGPEGDCVLTGKEDSHYFPPYIYTTGRMKGEAGQTYTLKVEYGGKTVTAFTTIPEPEPLAGLAATPVAGSDDRYSVTARLSNVAGAKKYYRVFAMVEGRDTGYLPCFPGTLEGENLREGAEITLIRGKSLQEEVFDAHFKRGDRVRIRFCTMDRESWAYWSEFDDDTIIGAVPVFPTYKNPPSNVTGGLGCFSGYGSSYYTLEIE